MTVTKPLIAFSALSVEEQNDIHLAQGALARARVSQSDFRVASALRATNGAGDLKSFPGCNTEYSAWGLTCCAERKALQQALDDGHDRLLCVTLTFARLADTGMAPCGLCRGALLEYGGRDLQFNCVVDANFSVMRWTTGEFLPERNVRKKIHWHALEREAQDLCSQALVAAKEAYAPYSGIKSGVAVLAQNSEGQERIFRAGRFENASYGATTTAVEIACGLAATQGFRNVTALSFSPGETAHQKVHPVFVDDGFVEISGAELQVARERGLNATIFNMQWDGPFVGVASLNDMLPYGFGPESMGLS